MNAPCNGSLLLPDFYNLWYFRPAKALSRSCMHGAEMEWASKRLTKLLHVPVLWWTTAFSDSCIQTGLSLLLLLKMAMRQVAQQESFQLIT